uniref:ECRG4 augurin n=1 Tax=Sus scrofa TaxID=9823 RepID=A0A8D1RV84_PIG
MAASSAQPTILVMTALALLLLLCLGPGGTNGNKLKLMLQKRKAPAPSETPVAVRESKAKEFLSSLRRQKRQLWDRTRPEVQQWYQHFLYLGFDEAVGDCACAAWLPTGWGTGWGTGLGGDGGQWPGFLQGGGGRGVVWGNRAEN